MKTSRLTRFLFGIEGELALKNLKRQRRALPHHRLLTLHQHRPFCLLLHPGRLRLHRLRPLLREIILTPLSIAMDLLPGEQRELCGKLPRSRGRGKMHHGQGAAHGYGWRETASVPISRRASSTRTAPRRRNRDATATTFTWQSNRRMNSAAMPPKTVSMRLYSRTALTSRESDQQIDDAGGETGRVCTAAAESRR